LGKYYWQIKVQSIDGIELMTSPILSFTVTSPSLAAPVLLGPAVNLLTKDTTVEMSWQSVAEAENYEIQISQTAKFADLVESSVQAGTTYTSESLPDGRYYWRVRTLNSYDAPGSWSAVRSFTVDTLHLTVPILASPLQGTMVNTFTPKLSVKTVSGAKSYQFQVFPTDSPDDVWVEATVNTPTYTLTSAQALKFGSFSWRARTIDAAGNESDWSQPVSFIVRLQKSPLPASYTKVANTTFTWAAFPGATGFRVKICEDEAMETGCRSSADLTAATLKYILPTPLPDGIYYWQIEVLGTALENPFTPVLSFTKVH
jgi:predicted phage tail protein